MNLSKIKKSYNDEIKNFLINELHDIHELTNKFFGHDLIIELIYNRSCIDCNHTDIVFFIKDDNYNNIIDKRILLNYTVQKHLIVELEDLLFDLFEATTATRHKSDIILQLLHKLNEIYNVYYFVNWNFNGILIDYYCIIVDNLKIYHFAIFNSKPDYNKQIFLLQYSISQIWITAEMLANIQSISVNFDKLLISNIKSYFFDLIDEIVNECYVINVALLPKNKQSINTTALVKFKNNYTKKRDKVYVKDVLIRLTDITQKRNYVSSISKSFDLKCL